MASGIGNKVASVTVTLNGVQETLKGLDTIKKKGSELKNEMKELKQLMAESAAAGNGQLWSQQAAKLSELEAASKACNKAQREWKKDMQDFDTLMSNFDKKTLADLNRDLKLAQDKFKRLGATDFSQLEKGKNVIAAIQAEISKRNAGGGLAATIQSLSGTLNNLKTAPLDRLKEAQKRLTDAVAQTTRGTREYRDGIAKLKSVNKQIDAITKSYQGQDNAIMKVAKRLASYVAVYMGFNQVIGQIRSVISGNIALSDSLADIQKVTKMTTGQVDALARSIDSIDTRSSQDQLYKLGYQAGMLGLKSSEDILGFIKAADQMNWALKELGEDGAVQLMKVANLTHETALYGVEKALNKVGSAINEITASSASSAAPIVDFVSRLGAVGAAAGYTSHELVAIGSTLDSLGVHAEMGSTAMNKFMIALQTNRSAIADQLGMTSEEMDKIAQNTDGASGSVRLMVEVLNRLHEAGGASANTMEVLEPIFKDLGSEGQRMITTLTTLIENVDVFNTHLGITRNAYEEGVSMLNEYNVKNETAAATFERLGNTMREKFVNSGYIRFLQDMGKGLLNIINHTNRWQAALVPLRAALGAVLFLMGKSAVLGVANAWASLADKVKLLTHEYHVQKTAMHLLNAAKVEGEVLTKAEAIAAAEAAVAEGTATAATVSWNIALKALWLTLASNPLTAVVAAIGAVCGLVYGLIHAFSSLSDHEQAVADANRQVAETMVEESVAANQKFEKLKLLTEQQEQYKEELDKTVAAGGNVDEVTKKLNRTESERKKLMGEINESYGPMLGYMLKEEDRLTSITAAQSQYNALLREKQALMIKDAINESATAQLKSTLSDEMDDLTTNLKDMAENMGIAEDRWGEFAGSATAKVIQLAQAGKKSQEIMDELYKLGHNMGGKDGAGFVNSMQLRSGINTIAEAFKNLTEWSKAAEKSYSETMKTIKQEEAAAFEERKRTIEARASASYYWWSKATTSAERERYAKEFEIGYNELVRMAREAGTEIGAVWEQRINSIRTSAVSATEDVNSKIIDSAKITSMTVDETVAALKRVNSVITMKGRGPEFLNQARAILGDINVDAATASERLVALGQQIRARQDALGVDSSGHIKKGSGSGSKDSKEQQQLRNDIDAYRKYLKDFYTQREIEEDNAFIDYQQSHNPTEIAAESAALEERIRVIREQSQTSLSELNKALLSQRNKLGEDSALDEYFRRLIGEGKLADLADVASRVKLFGERIWDDLQKSMSDAEKKQLESIIAHLKELDKLVKKYDFSALAEDQFQQMLAKQGLYNAQSYGLMKSFADDAYNVNAGSLQAVFNLNEMEANALLNILRDYHDAAIEAERKQKQRQKKIFDEQYEDRKKALKDEQNLLDENTEVMKQLQSLGLASDQDVNQMELLAIKAKMDAQREYVELLKASNADAAQAELELFNIQKDLADKTDEMQAKKLAVLKDYSDAVADFGAAMGEAAFGEVKDRKEAAKQLLKTSIDTTNKLILQQVQLMLQKQMLRKQEQTAANVEASAEVAIEQAKNQRIAASAAAATLQSISVKQAEVPAKVAAGTAAGGAETVGQMGWWGIPLMAVIAAALGALGSMAVAALSKSKTEVEAESGVSAAEASKFSKKKVAAGMMTYADGAYPVVGNDGNTYNATPVNRWGTRVYAGPHFGIIGERQPELIVDGQTTNKMLTLRPDLYQQILDLRDGIIRSNVRTYANGSYPAGSAATAAASSASPAASDPQLLAILAELTATNQALQSTIASGIRADLVEDFSADGFTNRAARNREWMSSHGLLR